MQDLKIPGTGWRGRPLRTGRSTDFAPSRIHERAAAAAKAGQYDRALRLQERAHSLGKALRAVDQRGSQPTARVRRGHAPRIATNGRVRGSRRSAAAAGGSSGGDPPESDDADPPARPVRGRERLTRAIPLTNSATPHRGAQHALAGAA